MKSLRLIIGILSVVICLVVFFQSCATGVVNNLESNTEDTSGGAGILLAFFLLVAGISAIVTRASKVGSIITGIIYGLGGIVGVSNKGTFGDLQVWATMSIVFACVFILSGIMMKRRPAKDR